MTRCLYLWTKRGASRHCKMLGTDKAWDVFDRLEENYFNPPQTKQMSPLEMIRGLADAAIKQERLLAEHEARLISMEKENARITSSIRDIEEEKTQVDSAIKEIREKVEQKAYPYPDPKRRDKIRNSVWLFAKESLYAFANSGEASDEKDVVNMVNVAFQEDFKEEYGIDLADEMKKAKLYYQNKYVQLKMDRALTPEILRPAKIRDLSIQAFLSTSIDWTNKAMELLAKYKAQSRKTRSIHVVA